MKQEILDWNVLRTRSRQEKKVELILEQKHVLVYLPKTQSVSRGRITETPLFPGYVFVKPQANQIYSLNFIPGSCGLVMHQGKPGVLRERELSSIRTVISARHPYDVHPGLVPGIRVRVTSGPLNGIEGELVRFKNDNRLVINASILGQAVSVEINGFEVVSA